MKEFTVSVIGATIGFAVGLSILFLGASLVAALTPENSPPRIKVGDASPGVTIEVIGRTAHGRVTRIRDANTGAVCYKATEGISCLPEKR